MRRFVLVLAIVLVLALSVGGAHQYGVPYVINLNVRGRRLTVTTLNDDRSIDDDPQSLADAAALVVGRAVDVNAYALARNLRSEEGSQPSEVKNLLAHVAMNVARARGVSILELLTKSTVASRDGKFGRQISRWASTAQDPYEQDLGVAEQALGETFDPTDGCSHYVDRLAFAVQVGAGSFADVAARWLKSEGVVPVRIPPAPYRIVFFRRPGAGEAVA